MNEKIKKLLSDTGIFFFGGLGSKVILFFLLPFYTRFLSPNEYGIADLVFVFVNFAQSFFSLSISDAVLRFALDKKNKSVDVLIMALTILSITSTLLVIISLAVAYVSALENWSKFAVIILILTMYRNSLSNFIKAVNKNKIYAYEVCLNTLILAVTSIVLIYVYQFGLLGYFYSQIISLFFSCCFLLFYSGLSFRNYNNIHLNKILGKKMLVYSMPMIANASFWWVINSSNRFFLNKYWGIAEIGLFAVAAKMPSLLTTLTGFFSQAWTIAATTEYDNEKDEGFYQRIYQVYSLVLFSVAIIVITCIKPLMFLLVGEAFKDAWKYVPYLIASGVFAAIASFFGAFYTAAYKNTNALLSTLFAAGVSILFNMFLIPNYGNMGASMSTFAVFFSVAVYRLLDTQRFFTCAINYKTQVIMTALLLLQCLFVVSSEWFYLSGAVSLAIIFILNRKFLMQYLHYGNIRR